MANESLLLHVSILKGCLKSASIEVGPHTRGESLIQLQKYSGNSVGANAWKQLALALVSFALASVSFASVLSDGAVLCWKVSLLVSGGWTRWSLRCLSTQTILWFHIMFKSFAKLCHWSTSQFFPLSTPEIVCVKKPWFIPPKRSEKLLCSLS